MPVPDHGPRRTLMLLFALLALVIGTALVGLWLVPRDEPVLPTGFGSQAGGAALQTAPQQDLARYRAEKQARLRGSGRLADDPGHAHIPIDRAMRLLSERAAPAPSARSLPGPQPRTGEAR